MAFPTAREQRMVALVVLAFVVVFLLLSVEREGVGDPE
jgi:hypothetical protein